MRVVFMGTPEFAVPTLEALLDAHEVVAVVSQPDKPKGRGKKMLPPAVKECAQKHGITVLQPEKVKDPAFIEQLASYAPELIVVVAFGQILPIEILQMPQYGCVNVHGSLLPEYRGAAPMQWSVIDGKSVTGITTMYMAKGLDSGDMLLKKEVPILAEDTYGSLYEKMSHVGAELLIETVQGLQNGSITPIPQDHTAATYAPMITKETGHISWEKSAQEIVNLIRGLSPAPGAYTTYEGETWKIWSARKTDFTAEDAACGEIVDCGKKGIAVRAADGCVLIEQMQAGSGKRMAADAYLRGHEVKKGVLLQ